MNELHAILDAWREQQSSSRDAVLATVVHVSGSSYRRPGARMLVTRAGCRIGSVSGGCLEGEIAKKAWWFTERGPVVRTYATTAGDDGVSEFGLGCNGTVHILLERTTTRSTVELVDFLKAQRESGEPALVATVIRSDGGSDLRVGDRLLLDGARVRGGTLAKSAIEGQLCTHAAEVLRSNTNRLVRFDQDHVFIERIGQPLALVIFGAGADTVPLVAIAAQLGWLITVADGRPALAQRERFPGADRVVTMRADDLLGEVNVHSETAVVLMTHNYQLDARLLPLILSRGPCYIGLLGPRSRCEQLFAAMGLEVPAVVHAPVGLDLGGDTPSGVALSIVAEIQAATNRRAGGMLRLRGETIHPPVIEVNAPVGLPSLSECS